MKWRSTVTVNASWMMPNIFRIDTKFTEDAKLKEFEFRRETLKHSTILGIVSLSLTIVFSSYSQPRCFPGSQRPLPWPETAWNDA